MKIHMVKKGDTLYELSKKYGITLEKLIEANPQLTDPNQLNIGDKVKIPSESVPVPMPDNVIHKHVVKQGDSLWQLSKAWGVTLRDMIDANPQLKNPNALLVGEVVNIPKTGQKEEVNAGGAAENTVHNKVTPGGKTHTGPKVETQPTETAPPVIPQLPQLPQLPENNEVPNNAPIQHIPQQPVPMPLPEMPSISAPSYDFHKEEKVDMSQHLFSQYSVPAQEAMTNAPWSMEKSNLCPVSDQMAYPGIKGGYSSNSPQYEQPSWEQQGYGHQPNWGQPQYMQSDCCSPNWSPYTGDAASYSNVGYGQGVSPQFNNVAPMENIQVTLSDVYSCISPYEWTFPQHMMPPQDMVNSAPQMMSYGENVFPNSPPVMQPQQDCGCHSRESSVGLVDQKSLKVGIKETSEEVVVANVDDNSIVGTVESIDGNETKKVQTSSANKGKGRSASADSKKDSKPKSRQQKRRNPWIKH